MKILRRCCAFFVYVVYAITLPGCACPNFFHLVMLVARGWPKVYQGGSGPRGGGAAARPRGNGSSENNATLVVSRCGVSNAP